MDYTRLYTQKDFDRIRQGRFTANNLNNCYNINKYLARYAAALDQGRTSLAAELSRKAKEKFGDEWTDLCVYSDVVV